jgi:hypothetical protein
MTIRRNEEWIQIGQVDKTDHLRFTQEFQSLMGNLGWEDWRRDRCHAIGFCGRERQFRQEKIRHTDRMELMQK